MRPLPLLARRSTANTSTTFAKREVCETLYLTVIHVARCAAVRNPARLADGTVERELIALVEGYLAPFERKE
jgi:hypothetical protein